MSNVIQIFIWVLLVTGVLNLIVAVAVYKKRNRPGGYYLLFMVLAMANWCFTGVGEQVATSVYAKQIWASFTYISVQYIPVLLLLYVLEFTRADEPVPSWLSWTLLIAPAWVLPFLFTNPLHHLYWSGFHWSETIPSVTVFGKGVLYWPNIIIDYAVLVLAIILLVASTVRFRHIYRKQVVVLLLSLPLPFAENILYLAGFSPVEGLDFTPTSFSVFVFLISWGFFRLDMFDLSPLARDHMIDSLQSAILVLNESDLVVDVNPAFIKMVQPQLEEPDVTEYLGRELLDVIQKDGEIHIGLQMRDGESKELHFHNGLQDVQYRMTMRFLARKDGTQLGRLAVFDDITEYKEMVQREVHDRKLIESIRDISLSLSSSLQQVTIDTMILEHLHHMIPLNHAVFIEVNDSKMVVRARFEHGRSLGTGGMREIGRPVIEDMSFDPTPWIHEATAEMFQDLFDVAPVNGWQNIIIIPLSAGGEVSAYIVFDIDHIEMQREELLKMTSLFSAPATIAFENQRLFLEKEKLATTDALTSLLNRRHFYELAARELGRSRRFRNPMSAMILDLDYFKDINDTYGHHTGDHTLVTVASILENMTRNADLVCRFGGEEFVVVFIQCDLQKAHAVAERIRLMIENTKIHFDDNQVNVTCSIGLTEMRQVDEGMDHILQRADRLLYQAKNDGRNRIVAD